MADSGHIPERLLAAQAQQATPETPDIEAHLAGCRRCRQIFNDYVSLLADHGPNVQKGTDMDPDAALEQIRAYATRVDSYWRDDEGNYRFPPQPGGRKADCSDEAEDAEQLVAYWQGLDEWLTGGGMLPAAWTQAERRSHKTPSAND